MFAAEIVYEEPSQFIEHNSSQVLCLDMSPSRAGAESAGLLDSLKREDEAQALAAAHKPPLIGSSKVRLIGAQSRIIKLANSQKQLMQQKKQNTAEGETAQKFAATKLLKPRILSGGKSAAMNIASQGSVSIMKVNIPANVLQKPLKLQTNCGSGG